MKAEWLQQRALVTNNEAAMTTWAVSIKFLGLGVILFSLSFSFVI